jgi:hypothetical protein
MAKTLEKVLKTDMSRLPLRKAAEQLRKKGRGRDTVLAHITPREAARLKAEGGSGTINPDTGLPEFDDGLYFDPTPAAYQPADFSSYEPPSYTPDTITQGPAYQSPTQDYTFLSQPAQGFEQPFQAAQYTGYFQPDISSGYYGSFPADQYAQATPAEIAQGRADVQNAYRTRYAPLPADVSFKAYDAPGSDVGGGEAIKASVQQQQNYLVDKQDIIDYETQVQQGLAEPGQYSESQYRSAGLNPTANTKEAAAGGLVGNIQKPGALYTPPSATEFEKQIAEAQGKPAPAETKGIQTPFGTLGTKDLIAALGLGGLGLSYMNAQNQGKKAADQLQGAYNQAAQQQMQLAQPYMQQGGTQLAGALTGALSPAQQQQLQAAQAAAAQGTSGAGGAGAAQAGRSIEDLRQRLLSNQQTMALQLLGAGTPLIGQAIQNQLSGTTTGINTQMALSQQAGQAATGMLGMLAMMYGRG